MAQHAMEVCVLKESNKVDSTATMSGTEITDHIPYCLSGLSRARFSDNLFRNGNDGSLETKHFSVLAVISTLVCLWLVTLWFACG